MNLFKENITLRRQCDEKMINDLYSNLENGLKSRNTFPTSDAGEKPDRKPAVRFLFEVFKTIGAKGHIILILSFALTFALGLSLPFINHEVMKNIYSDSITSEFTMMLIIFPLSSAAYAFLSCTRMIISSIISAKVRERAGYSFMEHVMKLPVSFFKEHSPGDIALRTEWAEEAGAMTVEVIYTNCLAALFSLVYVIDIAEYTPGLLIPSLIILTVQSACAVILGIKKADWLRNIQKEEASAAGKAASVIGGIQKIKNAGAEKRAFAFWGKTFSHNVSIKYNPPFAVKSANAIILSVSLAGQALIYFIASKQGLGQVEFFTFLTAFVMMSEALFNLPVLTNLIAGMRSGTEFLSPVLSEKAESKDIKAEIGEINGNIEIRNLCFGYTEGIPVIDNISLSIRKGEYVALAGASGCGKTTLARLLIGFEEPESGCILYDNHNIADIDITSLRRNVGLVLQNGKLLTDSLRNNITLGNRDFGDDEIYSCLESVGMAESVRKLPMGLNTYISEEGGNLSGGQRQKVLLARALITKPKVIILDEATSALDNISQSKIISTLDSLPCTKIVIAHRLTTIKKCDRIVFLENGKIADEGTYNELIAKDGQFAELVRRQMI